LRGRLVELSARGATATLTTSIDLVLEAARASESVAWITLGNGTSYPPDVADSGVDLAALIVVRVIDATTAARAAERLLRSGAFGLVVLDFGGGGDVDVPLAYLGRLVTLAQTHDAAIVCITDRPAEWPRWARWSRCAPRRCGRGDDYEVMLRAVKDKRGGPGWTRTSKRRRPVSAV
jgi:recombination protein RecA